MTLNHTRVTAAGREPERWLLVLHGIYGSGRNWGSIARRLVEARPEWGALLVDLRLHGGSATGFEAPHTLAAAAADVDRLVTEIDVHAAAVLGHSFGGKVALVYTDHHAGELRQTWVVDSTLSVSDPRGSPWRRVGIVRDLPESFASRDELADALVPHGYARPVGQWLAMNLERGEDARFRWRLDWSGVEALLRDYFRADVWGVIESPPERVEIHLVKATESDAIGDDDRVRLEAAASATGRVHLHHLEGGHWINTDNPDGTLDLLVRTLP